jgi:hypothetical protein
MPDTNVAISDTTLSRLRELARRAGSSVEEVLEQVVKDEHDRKCPPVAASEAPAESLDLAECWTEAGDVVPPEQEGAS